MGIGAEGYPYAGMAQTFLNYLGMHALFEHKTGVGMPCVMKPDGAPLSLSGWPRHGLQYQVVVACRPGDRIPGYSLPVVPHLFPDKWPLEFPCGPGEP
jgi:hypothetical protein